MFLSLTVATANIFHFLPALNEHCLMIAAFCGDAVTVSYIEV